MIATSVHNPLETRVKDLGVTDGCADYRLGRGPVNLEWRFCGVHDLTASSRVGYEELRRLDGAFGHRAERVMTVQGVLLNAVTDEGTGSRRRTSCAGRRGRCGSDRGMHSAQNATVQENRRADIAATTMLARIRDLA